MQFKKRKTFRRFYQTPQRLWNFYDNGKDQLKVQVENFPIELFFLRNSDIPQYIEDGVVDVAIVGENLLIEKQKDIEIVQKLGFSNAGFLWQFLKILKPMIYNIFKGKKNATSYPNTVKTFLAENNIQAEIHVISGS